MAEVEGMRTRFETVLAERPLEAVGWIGDMERATECLLPKDAMDFHDEEVLGEEKMLEIPDISQLGDVRRFPESIGAASSLGPLAAEAYERSPKSFKSPASLKLDGLRVITRVSRGPQYSETRILVASVKQEKRIRAEKRFMEKFLRKSSDRALHMKEHLLCVRLAVLDKGFSLSGANLDRLATHLPGRIIAEKGKVEPVTLELF